MWAGSMYLVEGFRLRVCLATGSQRSMSAVRRIAKCCDLGIAISDTMNVWKESFALVGRHRLR